LANSSLSTLLAVYCASKNFTLLEISFTTCLLTFSGAIAQWPIGFISDRVDRRKVIVGVAFGATIAAYFYLNIQIRLAI
jgi:MFS family permease